MVFAPHQDDETLGCGGAILQKIENEQDVYVVFMTDGSTSHANFLPAGELTRIRRKEAEDACKVLGVSEERIHFLEFPDGSLFSCQQPAIECVENLIRKYSPAEIFIPSRFDMTSDHLATNQIVQQALKSARHSCVVFEYPVWYWFHWPWVSVAKSTRYFHKMWITNTLKMDFGFAVPRYLNTSLEISNLLNIKKEALLKHKTQMTKPDGQKDWPVLGEVAQGDFLACFFRDREYFFSYAARSEEIA